MYHTLRKDKTSLFIFVDINPIGPIHFKVTCIPRTHFISGTMTNQTGFPVNINLLVCPFMLSWENTAWKYALTLLIIV